MPLLRNGYCPYKEVVASGPGEWWVLGQEKCSTRVGDMLLIVATNAPVIERSQNATYIS